jgi:hypothetical protein
MLGGLDAAALEHGQDALPEELRSRSMFGRVCRAVGHLRVLGKAIDDGEAIAFHLAAEDNGERVRGCVLLRRSEKWEELSALRLCGFGVQIRFFAFSQG